MTQAVLCPQLCVVVQASINNERDFDRVAEALIIQHSRIHLRASQRRSKGEGKDGSKRGANSNTRWIRGKGNGKHTCSGKYGTSAHLANLTSAEDHDYYATPLQAHNDPVDIGNDDGEER